MRKSEYNKIIGSRLTAIKKEKILFELFMFLQDARNILFKKGEWNPLKWHSVGRWVKLARLAYRLIKMVLAVMKG